MDGIEAQAVEAIFDEPVQRVVGEEAADFPVAKIDRRAPRRRQILAKHLGRVGMQIISVGSEMIVDDVEKDHQAVIVRGVDQRLQFVGRAVAAFRRKRQNAVVAPIARAGEIRDRHQFDGGYAEFGKPRQFADDAVKAAEHAGMQFVEDGFVPRPAAPIADDASDRTRDRRRCWRRARRPTCARDGRIGNCGAVLQHVAITRAGTAIRLGLEPAVVAVASSARARDLDGDRQRLLRRRPNAKSRAVWLNQIRTKRQAPVRGIIGGAGSSLE